MRLQFVDILRGALRGRPAAPEPSPAPAPAGEPPDDALQEHVRYAVGIAQNYLQQLDDAGISRERARILELGPGSDFGPALILASHGAEVTIADRFMADQNADHHRRLNARLLESWPGPNEAIRRAVEAERYDGVLTLVNAEVERLPCPDGSFDIVLSNAVLEHVVDLPTACEALFRVTAPGGVNSHQVDFRDHRDFGRPLEYLLGESDHFEPTSTWPGQYGSRRRPIEVERLFAEAGFVIEAVEINGRASASYLDDFMPRLTTSASPYRTWSRADLTALGALFRLRRP